MKHILFIVIPEKGHINPCIGVAQHLQQMGHDISFYSSQNISEQLQLAGFDKFLGPASISKSYQGAEFVANIQNPQWLRQWIKTLLVDQADAAVPELRRLIAPFDLIVTDPMIYPAVIAAAEQNKQWVALSNSLNPTLNEAIQSDLLDTISWLKNKRSALFQKYGLQIEFRGCDALSPHLTIAFSTQELTGYQHTDVQQVGPSIPHKQRGDEIEFPWDRVKPGVPLIYASFGSQIYHQPAYFQKIITAVSDKPVQLIAAVHELEFENLPVNVILTGYAPQLKLLQQADALITHGGANSVMEALALNTPIIINPICNDQFHQAWFLNQTSCGRTIDLDTQTPDEIWRAIDWALKADISHVTSSYQQDGAMKAAQLIHAL